MSYHINSAFGNFGGLTEQEKQIIGKCPNIQMPCDDGQGNDLWEKVSFLTDDQKRVLGNCPSTTTPCAYTDPQGNTMDLWEVVDRGGASSAVPSSSAPGPSIAPSSSPALPSGPTSASSGASGPITSGPTPQSLAPDASDSLPPGLPPDMLGPIIEKPQPGSDQTMMIGVVVGVIVLALLGTGLYFVLS